MEFGLPKCANLKMIGEKREKNGRNINAKSGKHKNSWREITY